MIFFLDENFPLSSIEVLKDFGFEVIKALDAFDQGQSDEVLFKYA